MLRMEYPEVQKANGDIESAKEALVTLGWEPIGAGNHAEAFTKGDRVVKIGRVNADNYMNYVRMIGLRTHNPHLPYIYSVQVFDMEPDTENSNPFYVVEMEKLDGVTRESDHSYWRKLLDAGNPSVLNQYQIEKVEPKTGAMEEVKKILLHLYNCYDARYDVRCYDGYTSNVMWRGDTAVFIDPVV